MADRSALSGAFGAQLQTSTLLAFSDLEARSREQVQSVLEHATRNCGHDRIYKKGRRSFQILAELDPQILKQNLFYFRRLIEALDRLANQN